MYPKINHPLLSFQPRFADRYTFAVGQRTRVVSRSQIHLLNPVTGQPVDPIAVLFLLSPPLSPPPPEFCHWKGEKGEESAACHHGLARVGMRWREGGEGGRGAHAKRVKRRDESEGSAHARWRNNMVNSARQPSIHPTISWSIYFRTHATSYARHTHVTHRANRYACNTVRTCERARTAVHAGIGTDPGIGQLHLEHGDSRWSCARKKYVSPRFVLSPSLFLSRPNFSLFLLSNPSSVPVPGKVFAVGRIRYSISYSRNDPIKM